MKPHWLKSILIAGVFLLMAAPAWADIDQRCLSTCISNGNSSAACMPECSYNLTTHGQAQATAPGTVSEQSHKLLSAPIPLNGVFLPEPSPVKTGAGKDYTCINQCLQSGWRYQLCEQRCTKKSCGPGTTSCRDLTGTSPGGGK